ncbi:hypothetical protein [Propionicimonas sp.]|uniref:hypothetical protein n=1 Tax=Propionicimonas sp. TaxID=1955623 RepID=UPI001831F6B6|nr:hypothetical protein [Propionicimonas sp.]MBA3019653.1 hypothetical protein [Propionicimonas sp.]MBU4208002.1 hypothetical protein [Actinomycetota bacterium]MBU4411460.1 hypothetical protein [Actinomycetota bacterium]MCG2805772.1 hypothetical protein [Propionicimonas sp.]
MKRSRGGAVLHLAILLLDAGLDPDAARIAARGRLDPSDVEQDLEHLVTAGHLQVDAGVVVGASDRARQACGLWCGRDLGTRFKAAVRSAQEDAIDELEAAQLKKLLTAAALLHPGLLEGVLAQGLMGLPWIDFDQLIRLRDQPTTSTPVPG